MPQVVEIRLAFDGNYEPLKQQSCDSLFSGVVKRHDMHDYCEDVMKG